MPTMQEKYAVELRDRDPATVDVLYLDNSEGGEIGGIDDSLVGLKTLSLVNCHLKSLKGFPNLPALQSLDLGNNELGDEAMLEVIAKSAPELERLILYANKLTSIEALRPLKMITTLRELDISANEDLGLTDDYRTKIFDMIPSLAVLDGLNEEGEEVEDDDFIGENGEDAESDAESGDESHDGPGLSYLERSQFSDDETDDYKPKEGDEQESRGQKRSADNGDEGDEDEPEAKKNAE